MDVDRLSLAELDLVMTVADGMAQQLGRPRPDTTRPLAGLALATLFYEPSTRTRVSFEAAARRLGADVTHVTPATSSVVKGETLIDTMRTLEALGAQVIVLRHQRSGAPWLIADRYTGHLVNAGDGWHAHPTQALLDLYTLSRHFPDRQIRGRKIAIVGDILHSRVARSNVWSLTAAGADLWLCGPPSLVRGFDAWAQCLPGDRRLTITSSLDDALDKAGAVMALRVQRERLDGDIAPVGSEYAAHYGITRERLRRARPDVVVLHPGPVNEGVEIAPDVASGPASLITRQVRNGVAVRMAVLSLLAGLDG